MSAKKAAAVAAPRGPSVTNRRLVNGLLFLGVLAAFTGWFFTLRPGGLGGPAGYILVRGVSMVPTYHAGDLVIVRREASYSPGEIVAYRVPQGEIGAGVILIHRIVGGSGAQGFTMKGDNNPATDPWHPTYMDVVGKAWIIVSKGGLVLLFLHSPLALASLATGIAIAYILVPAERKEEDTPRVGATTKSRGWPPFDRRWISRTAARLRVSRRSLRDQPLGPRWCVPHPDDPPILRR
jgi:signal peptidase